MTPPSQIVSDINFTTTKIQMHQNGALVGAATGFFFRCDGKEYLATNRHVVIAEKDAFYPDSLTILLHVNKQDLTANHSILIRLYSGDAPTWLQHPHYSEIGCDVVLIPMDEGNIGPESWVYFHRSCVTLFGPQSMVNEDVNPFSDLAIVGYPMGFHDEKNNLPVYRQATIASSYGVDFDGKPCFLIDANLHPGTSGSPVVNRHHTLFKADGGKEAYTLFGIHSAQYLMKGEPLGLNVVWYARLLPEIARHEPGNPLT